MAVLGAAMAMARPREVADEALKTVRIYDLMRAIPRATLQIHDPSYFRLADYGMAKETRQAVFLHPTGSVEFPVVHLSAKPVLSFKIGIDESAWDKPGDGVRFSVFVNRSTMRKRRSTSATSIPNTIPTTGAGSKGACR